MRPDSAMDMSATLGRMFGGSSDRVAELASWSERHLACDLCAAEACELLLERIDRFPPPKQVRGVYLEVNESTRHAMHVGQSPKAVDVGRVEAFWRSTGTKLIEAKVHDHQLASFIAAQMWWQRVHPDAAYLAEELRSGDIWETGARSYIASRGGVTRELMEAVWHRARKTAIMGDDAITSEDLNLGEGELVSFATVPPTPGLDA